MQCQAEVQLARDMHAWMKTGVFKSLQPIVAPTQKQKKIPIVAKK